jgi:hypothetical protein
MKFLTLFVALAGFGAASCGDEQRATPPPVDRGDARSVATAFLAAVSQNDVGRAVEYVVEEDREAFRRSWREAPAIPEHPELVVTEKVLDGVRRADVDVQSAGRLGLDMIYLNGAWWIKR